MVNPEITAKLLATPSAAAALETVASALVTAAGTVVASRVTNLIPSSKNSYSIRYLILKTAAPNATGSCGQKAQ